MSFKALLDELVGRVPGALGAILADWEGEAADQSGSMDDYELKVNGAHKGIILHNLRDVVKRLGNDHLQKLVITTGQAQTLVMPVTLDYFLVLTLERQACSDWPYSRRGAAFRRCSRKSPDREGTAKEHVMVGGLFGRLRAGWTKTREALLGKVETLLQFWG